MTSKKRIEPDENPMITGVCCILSGETLVAASAVLLTWFLIFFVANVAYVILYEDPGCGGGQGFRISGWKDWRRGR